MGRKATPQPLALGEGSSKAHKHANSNQHTNTLVHHIGAAGATGPTAAGASGATGTAMLHVVGTGARGEPLTAETAMQDANVSPAKSRSPVSLQSQPSQQSLRSEHSPFHSRSQTSTSLTSRFAATKRPQTSQADKAPLPTSTNKRPPQLQLHQGQLRDNSTATKNPSAATSPYYDEQAPKSPLQALRAASTEGERRPSTKSGFFHFTKSSKSSNQLLQSSASPFPDSQEQQERRAIKEIDGPVVPKTANLPHAQDYLQKPFVQSRSELSLSSAGEYDGAAAAPSPGGKRNKAKSFGLLSRNKSGRDKEYSQPQLAAVPVPAAPNRNTDHYDNAVPLRTAPVAQDRAFREMMNSGARNRSEDRAVGRDSSRDKERSAFPSSFKESGSGFFSGLRSSSTKAADMISKGLFGKSSRSGSTTEREPIIDDEHYVLKVLNLPLVEQTRKTRISKRLESSRDKTEFWMPAFPWRAIDYLNYKGCDVEGLYRVPGSGPQIKKWQRKFDERCDVDLFEEEDLYDINIIGSMLKAWLRELPDELFPKEAQDRIARQCAGATEVPQMLIDELSDLSPFNYYLLFAITCHLSLLLSHSDKNKMDFRNLCICFQPCMKIDVFCFRFLVCNWRDCWKGCKQEPKFIEDEYRLFDQPPPRGISEPNGPSQTEELPDRQPPSTDSSKPSNFGNGESVHQHQLSDSNVSVGSKISTISTDISAHSVRQQQEATNLRRLSPIKPLSPIGF